MKFLKEGFELFMLANERASERARERERERAERERGGGGRVSSWILH